MFGMTRGLKNKRKLSVRVIFQLGQISLWIIFAIVSVSFFRNAIQAISSLFFGEAVDSFIASNFKAVFLNIIGAVTCIIAMSVLLMTEGIITCKMTETLFKNIRLKAFDIIASGDVLQLQKKKSGDVVSTVNSDLKQLCDLASSQIPWLLGVFLQTIICMIGCLLLCWQLALIYFAVLPVTIWLINKISKKIKDQQLEVSKRMGESVSVVSESLADIMTIKSYGTYAFFNKKYADEIEKSCESEIMIEKISMKLNAVKLTSSFLQTVFLFLFGLFFLNRQIVTVGHLVTFIFLSNYVRNGFGLVDFSIKALRRIGALIERILKITDLERERTGGKAFSPDKYAPVISMKDVVFGYDKAHHVLKGINLEILSGQKVAFIGESGSGKSTLVKLICRLLQADGGKFAFEGNDVRDWLLDSMRSRIAYVSQEPVLFSGTLYDNIAFGKEGCHLEEVIQAAKDANIWEHISSLEYGLDTPVNQTNLSMGQKQKICIARAFLKNADLIIFDEIMASLDEKSQKEISGSIEKLLADKTAIIIDHRLSAVADVDYIFCFKDGKIAEAGKPEQLLAQKGYYYSMRAKQNLI